MIGIRTVARRPGAALAVAMCALAMVPAASLATSSFGSRYWTVAPKFGGFVNLGVPPSTMSTNNNEFVLNRNVVQTELSAAAGLIQVGYYTSGANFSLDNCGVTGQQVYKYYLEWRLPNGAFHCQLFGNAPPNPSDCPGSIAHLTSNGLWNAILGCGRTDLGSFDIGAASGWDAIGGELNGAGGLADCSSTRGGYGFNGDHWNIYFHSDRSSAMEVLNAGNTALFSPTTANWHVANVPTPFVITHDKAC